MLPVLRNSFFVMGNTSVAIIQWNSGNGQRLARKEIAMPTNMPSACRGLRVIDVRVPSRTLTDDFFVIAIFSGVGLLVSLVAIIYGLQGL